MKRKALWALLIAGLVMVGVIVQLNKKEGQESPKQAKASEAEKRVEEDEGNIDAPDLGVEAAKKEGPERPRQAKASEVDERVEEDEGIIEAPDLGVKAAKPSHDYVQVPAGEFMMGCNDAVDSSCLSDEKPQHEVYLDGFEIMKTEVSVEAYLACVAAGECRASSEHSDNCNAQHSERGKHPINCVSWEDAVDYCDWLGARLPTEAEWEKAARGEEGLKYPWGNEEASCSYAVMSDGGDWGCGKDRTWAVGSKPLGASPYGALDMSGNVWEWTADWYDQDYYSERAKRNPRGPSSGSYRVIRGGNFTYGPFSLRASNRYDSSPSIRYSNIGFRCAR